MTAPRRIDRYDITGVLGQGAHGTVYLAVDTKLDREVAVKVLNPELAQDSEAKLRFHREARAIAKLHHPNILEVFDYSGADSQTGYLVVERLQGENLDQLIAGRGAPLPVESAAAVGHEICLALEHAHAQGIVHRDIKPENIFIEPAGRIVLCDFGIARAFDQRFSGTLAQRQNTQVMGSPLFMSPEQVSDAASVGPASDLFALGSVLYFLVTGRCCFAHDTVVKVLEAVLLGESHPIRDYAPNLPVAFERIIQRAHELQPEARFSSAHEFAAALVEVLRSRGQSDPRETLAAAIAGLSEETHARQTRIANPSASAKTEINAPGQTEIHDLRTISGTSPQGLATPTAHLAAPAPRSRSAIFYILPLAVLFVVLLLVFAAPHRADERVLIRPQVAEEPAPAPVAPPPVAVTNDVPAKPKRAPVGEGELRLVAKPWADVYIDGAKIGTTPMFKSVQLSAGRHSVKLVNPSFPEINQSVEIRPNEATSVSFKMNR